MKPILESYPLDDPEGAFGSSDCTGEVSEFGENKTESYAAHQKCQHNLYQIERNKIRFDLGFFGLDLCNLTYE